MHARAMADTEASRGLLESLGFSQDGPARKMAFWDGAYHDVVVDSLLRSE